MLTKLSNFFRSHNFRKENMFTIFAFVVVLAPSFNSMAESKTSHQHEAHVHGVAELLIAQEGNTIELSFESPAANIVGFEHKAVNAEQEKSVKQAKEVLQSADKLFSFAGASCKIKESHVDVSSLLGHENEHHKEHEHKEHKHEEHKHEEHKHEEHKHKEHKHKEHKHKEHKHKEHKHKEHAGEHENEDAHSEVTASYHFVCNKNKSLNSMSVELFTFFAGIEVLNVSWISDFGQGGAKLSPASKQVNFR